VIWELRQKHKITLLLEIAGIARSTYYYHAKQLEKPDKYGEVKTALTTIYHENKGRYGYRRITIELHKRGFFINHKTVQ
jgi:transposase InsO family protein